MSQPDQPERLEDLALGVQARMAHTSGAQPALLVKALDGIGTVVDLHAVRQA